MTWITYIWYKILRVYQLGDGSRANEHNDNIGICRNCDFL